jgi:hypothetical protein
MLTSRSLWWSLAAISLAVACSSSGAPKDPIASPPAQTQAAAPPAAAQTQAAAPPAAQPPAAAPRPDPDLARDQ